MGIIKRAEMSTIKLTLPIHLADELRLLREAADRGGFEFSLEAEIGSALAEIRRQLPPDLLDSGRIDSDR